MSDHWFHGGTYQWQHWCDVHSVRGGKLGPHSRCHGCIFCVMVSEA